MVDVHVGVLGEAGVDEVDELLEGLRARRPGRGPGSRCSRPAVGPADQHAEEELEPAGGLEERVALHVEEEVTGRGRRQEAQAALVLRLEQAACELVGAAAVELEAGLVAQGVEHRWGDAGHVEGGR